MSDLKPCPFCNGNAALHARPLYTYIRHYDPETADKKYWVQCVVCATQRGANDYESEEKAVAAWNRRAEPENKPLTLEELQGMDEEPVWVQEGGGHSGWCLVDIEGDDIYFVNTGEILEFDKDFYNMRCNDPDGHFGLHVLGWCVFRQKPEINEYSDYYRN